MIDVAHQSAPLLLLAPSRGFGGGIERIAHAVEIGWNGPVARVDLYRAGHDQRPEGAPATKAAFATSVLSVARRRRPALVLALHVGLLPVAALAARVAGGRYALFAFGTEVWAPMSRWRRAMIRGCSSVLSISVFSRSVLARRAEMSAERVAVVPAPVTPELARIAATSARDLGGRASQLLTVSRLDPKHRYKGHFEIAQSFGQVVEQRPDARWVVVGDGEDLVTLQGQCDRLGIARSVEFMGHTTDSELARLYAHSCGLVMPSVADIDATPPTGEGFGLVYAEAGAFGTPSIASTASGGSGEFVVDGRTGLTVPPGHRDALALAMARLLADEGLRERLGAEARQRVLSDHTPERFQAAMRAALLAPDNSQRATGGARLPREARR